MIPCFWVGTKKGLFQFERSGSSWQFVRTHFLGDHVSMVMADPRTNMVMAGLDHGHFGAKVQRSLDGGVTFTETPAPVYPPQPEGVEEKDNWGKPWSWKLMKIWALEPGLANQPSLIWCGTIPGGLFRSIDNGDSWQIVGELWHHPKRKEWFGGGADFPGIHSICIHPQNGNHILVGVSCGGVWETTDGGSTWNCRADGMIAEYMPPEKQMDPNIQDPHRVVQCPVRPDHLWAQHHNGVFRSTDGARSWQVVPEVKPSVFGFAVAIHPSDPNRVWLIPAIKDERRIPVEGKVVVARTRDGGKSFEVLRKGLPQDHAYDLVYRHGLDIDAQGNTLAFGSTTGSLWLSENQGDTWQALSYHLPPIYCVRFVK